MKIKRLVIEEEVKDSPVVSHALDVLSSGGVEIRYVSSLPSSLVSLDNGLYLLKYRGKFFKNCPGTMFYNCCGYKIIHIGENCPLRCSYCILKAYFRHNSLVVWANIWDLFEELSRIFASNRGIKFRCGTGEFTDSLALEWLTSYSSYLIEFLSDHPNVCLELKSKVVDLSWVEKVKSPGQVLPAWSVNSVDIVATEEKGASSLEKRLQGARRCAEMGFRVCLHFDPVIFYPGWEKGYSRTLEMIFDYLRPPDIAYLSIGSFRGMEELFEYIEENWPESNYIYWGEFIRGMDGKRRLFRPLRIEQFRFLVDRLKRWGLRRGIYFCMESDEVWRAVMGYTPSEIGGLSSYLKEIVFGGE